MSEEVNPKTAADLPTEFDSPSFIGASAANSIAVSRFEEGRRGLVGLNNENRPFSVPLLLRTLILERSPEILPFPAHVVIIP
jgi:hypothetical protein